MEPRHVPESFSETRLFAEYLPPFAPTRVLSERSRTVRLVHAAGRRVRVRLVPPTT